MSEPVQDSPIEGIFEADVDGRWIDELAVWMLPGMWCGRQIHHTARTPRPPLQPGAVHR
ncbi:hypothetical protein [Embleya sp. MST-111070]|uniref:hypothetical protein n=1 Tax=Embleya sp. MST-111070 TaxID=3398231 RepID=UPI003F731906